MIKLIQNTLNWGKKIIILLISKSSVLKWFPPQLSAFSICFLLLCNVFVKRASFFMAAYIDLGEKGHEVKTSSLWKKWHLIGGKPWIDFWKSGLALVNLVYKRKSSLLSGKVPGRQRQILMLELSQLSLSVGYICIWQKFKLWKEFNTKTLEFTLFHHTCLYSQNCIFLCLHKFVSISFFYIFFLKIWLVSCMWFFFLFLVSLWPSRYLCT